MSQGWMRIREASQMMDVSQSTVRRRMESGELRGRVGPSGRQEVFLPAKLRRELEAAAQTSKQAHTPGHLLRGVQVEEADAAEADSPSSVCDAGDATEAEPSQAPGAEQDKDVLKRYERLAGGSLILAQQHSDELKKHADTAYEQLAHTRSQVRHLRKFALAGWAGCAAAVVFGLVLTVNASAGKHRAEARAASSQSQADQAQQRADELGRLLSAERTGSVSETDGVSGRATSALIHEGRPAPERSVSAPAE